MPNLTAYFNHFTISLTRKDVISGSARGERLPAIMAIMEKPYVQKQLASIDKWKLIEELKETGAWGEVELMQDSLYTLQSRVVWIAACNIKDEIN